jgi:hypothetical protein
MREKIMPPAAPAEYNEILARVQTWPAEQRLRLAEDLLRSFHPARGPDGVRGVPVEQVRGVAAGVGPAPDDDTVRRLIAEHQREKCS